MDRRARHDGRRVARTTLLLARTLFGKPFASYDKAAFLRISDLYDIGWVLSHTRRDTRSASPGSRPRSRSVASHGQAALFRVERAAARLWSGHGVAFEKRTGSASKARTGSPSVLKYHWIPGLTASPRRGRAPGEIDESSPCEFLEIDHRRGSYLIGLAP